MLEGAHPTILLLAQENRGLRLEQPIERRSVEKIAQERPGQSCRLVREQLREHQGPEVEEEGPSCQGLAHAVEHQDP